MYTLKIVPFNPQAHLKIEIDSEIPHPLCRQRRIPAQFIFLQLLNRDYNFTTDFFKGTNSYLFKSNCYLMTLAIKILQNIK